MTDRIRLPLVGVIAIALAALPIGQVTADGAFYLQAMLLTTALFGAGVLLRLLPLPWPVVPLLQLGGIAGYAAWQVTALTGPTLSWDDRVALVFARAVNHVQTQVAPMSENPEVRLFLVLLIGLAAWSVDMCLVTGNSPAAAFVPIGSLYLLPAVGLRGDLDAFAFLPVATAMCLVVLASESVRARQWLGWTPSTEAENVTGGLGGAGMAAALGVLTVTLAAGLFLPRLTPITFDLGSIGAGPLQMTDPSLDLRRNLNQPSDRVVIRYQTDQPSGAYLRMATLPKFDGTGWHLTSIDVRYGGLPAVPGFTGSGTPRRTELRIDGFSTQWLPLPYAPRQVTTSTGRWGFNPDSLDLISRDPATDGLEYQVASLDVEPSPGSLRTAAAGRPAEGDLVTTLPADLPAEIRELAHEITRGISNPAGQAIAIQEYLRSPRFRYSTDPRPGMGYEALQRFLFDDRSGYCEQFAAAMAVLSREVGLPSRVVVGFLPGTLNGDTWEVSIRSMHAWPELYFAELGWVRFEPTPSVASPPAHTQPGQEPTPSLEPSQSETTTQAPEPTVSGPEPTEASTTPSEPTAGGTGWFARVAGGGLAAATFALLLAVPRIIRGRRRSRRLGLPVTAEPAQRAEAAWAELRDTVLDLGDRWPTGSPRSIGRELAPRLPDVYESELNRLVGAVEQGRYARDPAVPEDLFDIVRDLSLRLGAAATSRHRFRARWLPRSLWVRSA